MVDFTTPIPKYSTQRIYETVETFDDFVGIKTDFLTNNFLEVDERSLKSASFSTVINIIKNNKVVAKIRIDTTDETTYTNFLTETAKAAYVTAVAGTGASAAEDVDKRNWKYNFIGVSDNGDEFKLLIDDSYATLYDYTLPATCNSIEAWADTVEAISNDPTA